MCDNGHIAVGVQHVAQRGGGGGGMIPKAGPKMAAQQRAEKQRR